MEVVRNEIRQVIRQSRQRGFEREYILQGFILRGIQDKLPEGYECAREVPTRGAYKVDPGSGLLTPDKKGGPAYIDLMIRKGGIGHVGIEIEKLTSGELRNPQWFESHLKNDVLKLKNQVGLDQGYVLVFAYHDSRSFESGPVFRRLESDMGTVKLAYLRLNTKDEDGRSRPLKGQVEIPEGWLGPL